MSAATVHLPGRTVGQLVREGPPFSDEEQETLAEHAVKLEAVQIHRLFRNIEKSRDGYATSNPADHQAAATLLRCGVITARNERSSPTSLGATRYTLLEIGDES